MATDWPSNDSCTHSVHLAGRAYTAADVERLIDLLVELARAGHAATASDPAKAAVEVTIKDGRTLRRQLAQARREAHRTYRDEAYANTLERFVEEHGTLNAEQAQVWEAYGAAEQAREIGEQCAELLRELRGYV